MNWKNGKPPKDFVGFAIEYKEPEGDRFFALKNRLSFPGGSGEVNPNALSTRLSPIQKFRWVHFPHNAELPGEFVYRVTPVFMNANDELSYGEMQEFRAADLRPLEIARMGVQTYDITHYQPVLFCAESFAHIEDVVGGFFATVDDEAVRDYLHPAVRSA